VINTVEYTLLEQRAAALERKLALLEHRMIKLQHAMQMIVQGTLGRLHDCEFDDD
jgi:hypothetical protein